MAFRVRATVGELETNQSIENGAGTLSYKEVKLVSSLEYQVTARQPVLSAGVNWRYQNQEVALSLQPLLIWPK